MSLLDHLDRAALAAIYALATGLRSLIWRIRRPMLIGVRALVVREHTVLLIRHRFGRTPWALPGGGVERFLGLYERFGGGVSNYIGVYVCTPTNEPDPPRSLEIAEARFFSFDALPRGLDPGSRRRIEEYRRGEHGLARPW
jgi:hypothetical protein